MSSIWLTNVPSVGQKPTNQLFSTNKLPCPCISEALRITEPNGCICLRWQSEAETDALSSVLLLFNVEKNPNKNEQRKCICWNGKESLYDHAMFSMNKIFWKLQITFGFIRISCISLQKDNLVSLNPPGFVKRVLQETYPFVSGLFFFLLKVVLKSFNVADLIGVFWDMIDILKKKKYPNAYNKVQDSLPMLLAFACQES